MNNSTDICVVECQ